MYYNIICFENQAMFAPAKIDRYYGVTADFKISLLCPLVLSLQPFARVLYYYLKTYLAPPRPIVSDLRKKSTKKRKKFSKTLDKCFVV